MDPRREGPVDQILANIDRSRRGDRETTFSVGPFTLCWDYARPTFGSTVFTASDVRKLVRCANEEPPWGSIPTNELLVEWSGLEWIVERAPRLAPAVSGAGLTVSTNPLLIKRSDTNAGRVPALVGTEIEIVDPDSDPRELLAAWHFMDSQTPVPPRTADVTLEQIRLAAASVTEFEVGLKMENRALSGASEAVVRLDGRIVAAGMHERSLDAAEITSLAVLPPFRRRGFGTALAAALAADAFDGGADLVFVESAPEAATMYERAGFQLIGAVGRADL
jgi:GNAT superfamily N-acetyltransferase